MKKRILPLFLCMVLLSFALCVPASAAGRRSDRIVSSRIGELLFGDKTATQKTEERTLSVGGDLFGMILTRRHPEISAVREGSAADGILLVGDEILKIDGKEVSSPSEAAELVESAGETVEVTVLRGGKEIVLTLPHPKEEGLGIDIRGSAAGIGTVTFTDPQTGVFAGLGHAVTDPGEDTPIAIRDGKATEVLFGGARKGVPGDPGELSGVLKKDVIGTITENTECGTLGSWTVPRKVELTLPVADRDEVHPGAAVVRATVTREGVREYAVTLSEIKKDETSNKCFVVEVTDPTLLAVTGGIVRGMSGSPIIQDGKLVGALTHVLISDPTTGYGIFIDNMPGYAAETQKQAA